MSALVFTILLSLIICVFAQGPVLPQCSCSQLGACIDRKVEEKRTKREQCKSQCGPQLGQYQSAAQQCITKSRSTKTERRDQRRLVAQCVLEKGAACSGGFPGRLRRQTNTGVGEIGSGVDQVGRRGMGRGRGMGMGRGRGMGRGMGMRRAYRQFRKEMRRALPKEYNDYRKCLKTCRRGGRGNGGGGMQGTGNGGGGMQGRGNGGGRGNGRGMGGRRRGGMRGRRGTKIAKACGEEMSCSVILDRQILKQSKRACKQELNIQREDGRRRAELTAKCECLKDAFRANLNCVVPEQPDEQLNGPRNRRSINHDEMIDTEVDFDLNDLI